MLARNVSSSRFNDCQMDRLARKQLHSRLNLR
jgi:hypothetical protein